MIRDLVRTACVLVVMTVACALLIETRHRLVVLDLAHRQAAAATSFVQVPTRQDPPGPLAQLGRATLGLADAALQVVR